MCQRAETSCPLQADWVDLAGASPRGSTALRKTVICRYFSQTQSHLPYRKIIATKKDLFKKRPDKSQKFARFLFRDE